MPATWPIIKATRASDFRHSYAGKPDAGTTCLSGLEGAGRKRASVMVLRAALPPYATRYLAANPGDLRGLAAILGHSDLNTVMVYTAPKTSDLAARMERAETTGT
jgi:integrase